MSAEGERLLHGSFETNLGKSMIYSANYYAH